MAELLAALAAHHDPLIVTGPLEVLDTARQRLELVAHQMLPVRGVPDAHLAGLIGRGDVEARGRVLCHLHRLRVLSVDVTGERGRLDAAYEHAVAVHVEEVLAFRVAAQHCEGAAGGARQRGEDVLFERELKKKN